MKRVRILVDSFADKGLLNAQMTNAREIIRRLDPELFNVSTFCVDEPDLDIAGRPNTRLIKLPRKRQTATIFREFILGKHEILFYLKSSPASKWYLRLRQNWRDHRITVGTVESRCDFATSRLSRRKPFAFGSKQFYAAIICSVIRAQCSKASNRNTV